MTIEPQLMSITKLAYRLHYNLAPSFILRCFFHKRSTNKKTPTLCGHFAFLWGFWARPVALTLNGIPPEPWRNATPRLSVWHFCLSFSSSNCEILERTAKSLMVQRRWAMLWGSDPLLHHFPDSAMLWGISMDKSPISRFKAKYSFVNPSLGSYSKFETLYQFLRFLSPFFVWVFRITTLRIPRVNVQKNVKKTKKGETPWENDLEMADFRPSPSKPKLGQK